MKRALIPAAGVALLQAINPLPATADDAEWARYASSGYDYCDAVILAAQWGEGVDDAKATIGRKLGFGNKDIIEENLTSARASGKRCEFQDTQFSYDDAEALSKLWRTSVTEAKAALAEKASLGFDELAVSEVKRALAQFPSAPK